MQTETTAASGGAKRAPGMLGTSAPKVRTRKTALFDDLEIYTVGDTWKPGQKLAGRYVGTKEAVSDKFIGGFQYLHVLKDVEANADFGIWGVGTLNALFKRVPSNAYVILTYKGLGKNPLREGQNPPHEFEIELEDGVELVTGLRVEAEIEPGRVRFGR